MDFDGPGFPGIPDPALGRSQRSYSYDPLGSRRIQSTHYSETAIDTIENITWHTVFGVYSPIPPTEGNLAPTKPASFSSPDWFGGWWSNDWNSLRAQGIGYGLYAPHLPAQPVPVWKLYEPGSGFILPATFLGQPLAPATRPPGT